MMLEQYDEKYEIKLIFHGMFLGSVLRDIADSMRNFDVFNIKHFHDTSLDAIPLPKFRKKKLESKYE